MNNKVKKRELIHCLNVLMQKAEHYRMFHGYQKRIAELRYNKYYIEADIICGEIMKLGD